MIMYLVTVLTKCKYFWLSLLFLLKVNNCDMSLDKNNFFCFRFCRTELTVDLRFQILLLVCIDHNFIIFSVHLRTQGYEFTTICLESDYLC